MNTDELFESICESWNNGYVSVGELWESLVTLADMLYLNDLSDPAIFAQRRKWLYTTFDKMYMEARQTLLATK